MHVSRRHFFQALSAAALARGLRLPAAEMIVRAARPEDFEMPLSGFDSWLTPNERFFVRTHVYTAGGARPPGACAWREKSPRRSRFPWTISNNCRASSW